jgi:UDP-N-acetylglucosamine--N-acetylmuramyl-(pentapeptide) pyrophosphoryl-undecaprenol N-acetylglucosamine transferase
LLIHEQNSVAGTTNRMLAPFAKRIVSGFPGAFSTRRKAVVTGNPLRQELIQAGQSSHYDYDGKRALRLLIVGGSLGAGPINEVVPGALRRVLRDRHQQVEVWHQTGEIHYPEMQRRYHDFGVEGIKVVPFIEQMAEAYQWADLVVCRAGALTVSELAVMGRPSLLVPLPQAIDDHQRLNALTLADAGAGHIIMQSELDAHRLSIILRELINNPELLQAMSAAAFRVALPDATDSVCNYCEELING